MSDPENADAVASQADFLACAKGLAAVWGASETREGV